MEMSMNCWWEWRCKLKQPLKLVWGFIKKMKIKLSYDLAMHSWIFPGRGKARKEIIGNWGTIYWACMKRKINNNNKRSRSLSAWVKAFCTPLLVTAPYLIRKDLLFSSQHHELSLSFWTLYPLNECYLFISIEQFDYPFYCWKTLKVFWTICCCE